VKSEDAEALKERFANIAITGARTSLQYCLMNQFAGAGSNSQCLFRALWIMLATSATVQDSKLANAETSLDTMTGGVISAVKERMSLTLPSKNFANKAAECGLLAPPSGRSRQLTLLHRVFESSASFMVTDQYWVNLRLKVRRTLFIANCSRHWRRTTWVRVAR